MRNMRKNMGIWLLSKCQFACQSCVCVLVRAILFGPDLKHGCPHTVSVRAVRISKSIHSFSFSYYGIVQASQCLDRDL